MELHRKMTWQEFEDFPRLLGWKHEYYDGALHLSPSKTAITTFQLRLAPRPVPQLPATTLRPVRAGDEMALARVFCAAFRDGVEYAGWPRHSLRSEAVQCIGRFFASESAGYHDASFVAERAGRLVGAALIRRRTQGPILEPVYIAPGHQRRGLGAALLAAAVNRLVEARVEQLGSRCHLGNDASLQWHRKQGFVELPNYLATQHRAYYHGGEAERLKRSGEEQRAREQAELAAYWHQALERLEELLRTDPEKAFGRWD